MFVLLPPQALSQAEAVDTVRKKCLDRKQIVKRLESIPPRDPFR